MIRPQQFQKRLAFHGLLFVICLIIVLWATPFWVRAQDNLKPKLQEWQINGILAALDDGYPQVKQMAFGQIVQIGQVDAKALKPFPKQSEEIAQKAIGFVSDSKIDPAFRISAAQALGKLGKVDGSVVQFLTNLVSDSEANSYLRVSAAQTLGAFGKSDKNAMQFLMDLINNSKTDPNVRSTAINALATLGEADEGAMQFMADLVNDRKTELSVRTLTIQALGTLDKADESVVRILTDLVNDSKESSNFRSTAIFALGALGKADESVVQSLTNIVNDSKADPSLRMNAVQALGRQGKADESVVQSLTNIVNDNTAKPLLRSTAISALGALGKANTGAVQFLTSFLNNSKADPPSLRINAAMALSALSKANTGVVQSLTNLVNDSEADPTLRINAAMVLGNLRQLNLAEVFVLIDPIYDLAAPGIAQPRFASYFYGGGDHKINTLLKWLGRPDSKSIPTHLTHAEARETLEVFRTAWEPSRDFKGIRNDLVNKIATVADIGQWETSDVALLTQHYQNLKGAHRESAYSVKAAIDTLTVWQPFLTVRNLILIHLAFWFALIVLYPKFSTIQALFFWNPWVRTIAGLGYVNALLVTVPFLQRRLFTPFQKDLRQAAGLDQFDPTAYFQQSRVKRSLWSAGKETEEVLPLTAAIPNLKGQMLLQAPSGFGKTLFLRHLINQSPQRTTVFLTATECAQAKDHDVIQAIQAKLPIAASDPNFLKSLIYSGAIDICIDGLNEINAEAQASIKQFLSSYTQGNIILTTQPLSDKNPPQSAKLYRLLPLDDQQISRFLTSRHPEDAILQGEDYQQACDAYLKEVLNPDQSPEDREAIRRVLSNPMDLDTVAEMLAHKERPELFRLQQQLYDRMAADYADKNNGFNFPLKPFAQLAYDMRLSDQNLLPKDKLSQEIIDILEKHKLLTPKSGSWQFRHDKIWDFFIVQKYLEDQQKAYEELREPEKMKDTRLRGVYLQLATELDLPIAQVLEKALFAYASSTGDHTTSDPFRRRLEYHPKAPAPIPL